jgi:uncharacterized membrane protein
VPLSPPPEPVQEPVHTDAHSSILEPQKITIDPQHIRVESENVNSHTALSRANIVEIQHESLKELKFKKGDVVVSEIDDKIETLAQKYGRRMLFKKEKVEGIFKIYYPLYQIFFDYYPPKGKYQSLSCFVDGITGEILYGKGKRTRGVRDLLELTPDQRLVMVFIMQKKQVTQSDIIRYTHFDKRKVKRIISALIQKGLIYTRKYKTFETKKFEILEPKINYELITDPRKKISKFFQIDEDFLDDQSIMNPILKEKEAKKAAEIWERSVVWDTKLVYYPYFLVSYPDDHEIIDGVTGKKDGYVKAMLTFRL